MIAAFKRLLQAMQRSHLESEVEHQRRAYIGALHRKMRAERRLEALGEQP